MRELRDRILTGTLPPDTRLDLDRIAEEFGISRTPVHEALLELSFPRAGFCRAAQRVTVVGVSHDATVHNFAILAALSGKAAESAATRFSPDELAQLERVAETLEGSESGDPMIHANSQFHRVINEAARSQHLLSLIRQAVRLIPFDFLAVLPVHDNTGHREPLRDLRAGPAGPRGGRTSCTCSR